MQVGDRLRQTLDRLTLAGLIVTLSRNDTSAGIASPEEIKNIILTTLIKAGDYRLTSASPP